MTVNRAIKKSEGVNQIRTWLANTPSLTEHERAVVLNRTVAIMHRIERIGNDREALAKDMLTVQKILKPRRLWDRWLSFNCWNRYGASRAKCHRIIKEYVTRGVVSHSPAVRAGLVAPGKQRPDIVVVPKKESPAHQSQTPPVSISHQPARGRWRSDLSAEQAAIETFTHWRPRIDLVAGKEKGLSLDTFVGMALAYLGMGGKRFEPQALPEGLRKGPKNSKASGRQLARRAA